VSDIAVDANLSAAAQAAITASHAAVTLSMELDAILALSTQAIDLDTQAANTVIAGPATGAAAKPTARALVQADIAVHGSAQHDSTVRLANPRWLPAYWTWQDARDVSQAGVAKRVWLHPVWFPRTATVSAMTMRIYTASSGANIRLVLYADNGGTPAGGAVLGESGNISITTGGIKLFTFAAPISITNTWAWVGLQTPDTTCAFSRGSDIAWWTEVGSEFLNGCSYDLADLGVFTDPCPAVTARPSARFNCWLRLDSWDS
jgi:hypothetical protein